MDLAAYLAERKIRPATFAAEIGVPPSTISRILKGERDPRGATVRRIVEGSGGKVTAEELLRGLAVSDQPPPPDAEPAPADAPNPPEPLSPAGAKVGAAA